MTKQADVENLVAEARKAFGDTIDILVNVVGGLVARKPLAEMDEEFFEYVMKLNVTSTFLTTKAVVPHMGDGGSIVNFSSQAGRDGGGPGASAYATSKGAIMTFTRGMAKELGPSNIRVNCVCPGMISTTFHDTFTKDQVRANVAAATPLRREGQAKEVADLVTYLASPASSFITGAERGYQRRNVFLLIEFRSSAGSINEYYEITDELSGGAARADRRSRPSRSRLRVRWPRVASR